MLNYGTKSGNIKLSDLEINEIVEETDIFFPKLKNKL